MQIPNREADVIKKYQLTNLVNNNNKWWTIEWWKAEKITRVTYGRVGQDCARPAFKDGIDEKKFNAMLRKREKPQEEGTYKEIIVGQKVAANYSTDGLSQKLVSRINKIFAAANENIGNFLTINVDNLSLDQLEAGKDALADIVRLHSSYKKRLVSDAELIAGAEKYYNLIPSKLPAKIKPLEVSLNLANNAADEEDKLQQLVAAVSGLKVAKAGGSILDQLGCKMEEADFPEFKFAEKYFNDTKRHYDRSQYKVKEVWRVEIPQERKAFNEFPVRDNIKTLWHGTRDANVRHILRKTGLIIPRYAANGSMYGRGIYLANISTKSLGYCGYGNEKYLFLIDAILGNQYVTYSTGSWIDAPKGYHSVYAPAGKQNGAYSGYLGFDEFILYKPEQQTIKYLVVVE